MDFDRAMRLALILLSLFPALWGLLAVLNNLSGFSGTVDNAVAPLLAMSQTYGLDSQAWRAIHSPLIASLALIVITGVEGLAGIVGALALFQLIRHYRADYQQFSRAKGLLVLACTLAIGVWGIGFMVIAGDWFLAWQKPSGLNTQLGGLLYMLPCLLTIIVAGIHKEAG